MAVMARGPIRTVAIAAALVAPGCLGDASDGTLLDERLERVAQLVALHCESTEACACEVTVAQAGCAPTLTDQWRARLVAGEERELTYDPACLDTIEAGIDGAVCAWPPADDRHPCHEFCQVFHGTRGEGERCDRFDDLVSDCDQGLLCDQGRCVTPCAALSGLQAGERCRDAATFTELDRCADGLACIGDEGRCAQAPPAGEPCLLGECAADSYCDYNGSGATCRRRVGEGANCESAACEVGLACTYVDDNSGNYQVRCTRRGKAGEPCSESGCEEGLGCGIDGRCTPLGDIGSRCDVVNCREGLLCDYSVSVCAVPPPAGQPCLSGECARGAYCETTDVSLCVAGQPRGTACTGHRQCESGYCPAGFCDVRPGIGDPCAGSLVCDVGASCDGAVCRASVTHGPAVCVYEGW